MEEDRTVADLGPDVPAELEGEEDIAKKTPKRRFIGRRAAEARAATKAETDGIIEDTGPVQGAASPKTHPSSIANRTLIIVQQWLPAVGQPAH